MSRPLKCNVLNHTLISDNEDHHYVKRIKWTDSSPVYASLHNVSPDLRNVTLSDVESYKTQMSCNQATEIQVTILKHLLKICILFRTRMKIFVQAYTELLIPLLLDIFIEVAPQKTKNQRTGQHLSNDAAVLLRFTVDIILLLWQIYDASDSCRILVRNSLFCHFNEIMFCD